MYYSDYKYNNATPELTGLCKLKIFHALLPYDNVDALVSLSLT